MSNLRQGLLLLLFCCSVLLHAQTNNGFVTVDNSSKTLKWNGSDFFALGVNYSVSISKPNRNSKEAYIAPNISYNTNGIGCSSKEECYQNVKADIRKLKELGFNSIRLVGLVYGMRVDENDDPILPTAAYEIFPYDISNGIRYDQAVASDYSDLFGYISEFMRAVNEVNQEYLPNKPMKVQLLSGGKRINDLIRNDYIAYLKVLSDTFKNQVDLYSYDFFNEPGYNTPFRDFSKAFLCEMVKEWDDAVKLHTTNQLTTIGLTTSDNVAKWDPGFLNVDFLSYHVYPPRNGSVFSITEAIDVIKREVYWYQNTAKKPWMIGEIGFGANDNAPYSSLTHMGDEDDQQQFFEETMRIVDGCGGVGYKMWQYKDVDWGSVPQRLLIERHWGLFDRDGTEKKCVQNDIFNTFMNSVNTYVCTMPSNYYNQYNTGNQFYLEGYITNQYGQPIKDAFVRGWDASWGNSDNTFTDANGYYKLRMLNTPAKILVSGYGMSRYFSETGITNFQQVDVTLQEHIADIVPSNFNVYQNNVTRNNGVVLAEEAENNVSLENYHITSSNTSITAKAGGIISLLPGFKADYDTYFKGEIIDFETVPLCQAGNSYYRKKTLDEVSELDGALRIFPNPGSDFINIDLGGSEEFENGLLFIYDIQGKEIRKQLLNNNQQQRLDVSDLENGTYMIRIQTEQEVVMEKWIKQ